VRVLLAAAVLSLCVSAKAQAQGQIDAEAAEMMAELMGAPVFASDGQEVGRVADIAFDDEGRPQRLRMTAGAKLGLGSRSVEIPDGAFIAVRGAIVLELPFAAVQSLPELDEHGEEK
jgi:sporulation protein YlmC with PRC-barrel domain